MLCPEELAAVVNAISISISQGRSSQELTFLSNVFTQIGDTLTTIASQRVWVENSTEAADKSPNDI